MTTTRRLALVAAATVATVLSACTNPTAPAASRTGAKNQPNTDGGYMGSVGNRTRVPERPNADGGYMGSVGIQAQPTAPAQPSDSASGGYMGSVG